jgi:hypothetical protein
VKIGRSRGVVVTQVVRFGQTGRERLLRRSLDMRSELVHAMSADIWLINYLDSCDDGYVQ